MCGDVLLVGNLYWSNNERKLPVPVGRGQLQMVGSLIHSGVSQGLLHLIFEEPHAA